MIAQKTVYLNGGAIGRARIFSEAVALWIKGGARLARDTPAGTVDNTYESRHGFHYDDARASLPIILAIDGQRTEMTLAEFFACNEDLDHDSALEINQRIAQGILYAGADGDGRLFTLAPRFQEVAA